VDPVSVQDKNVLTAPVNLQYGGEGKDLNYA